jgi:hypothetical protein
LKKPSPLTLKSISSPGSKSTQVANILKVPSHQINDNPESAKQALRRAGARNPILDELGFASTDELLMQFQGDEIAIRRRDCIGKGTCPSVIVQLSQVGSGTQVTQRSVLASTGHAAILFATVLLGTLLLICIASLPFGIFNPYTWLIGISSGGILIYIWTQALLAKRSTELSAAKFLQTVWSENGLSNSSRQSLIIDSRIDSRIDQGKNGADVQLPMKLGTNIVPRPSLDLKDMPTEGRAAKLTLGVSAAELLQQLKQYEQSNEANLPQSLGFGNRAHFDIKLRKDQLIMRRVRPTNSWLFRLFTHFIDLDFGPRLEAKVSAGEGKAVLSIVNKTTLFRKLWTVLVYTFVMPSTCFILLGLPCLALGLAGHDDRLALLGLLMLLVSGGGFWTMADLRSSDKTEYMALLSHLGEVLSALPCGEPSMVHSLTLAESE